MGVAVGMRVGMEGGAMVGVGVQPARVMLTMIRNARTAVMMFLPVFISPPGKNRTGTDGKF